jgi:hypothetical protein
VIGGAVGWAGGAQAIGALTVSSALAVGRTRSRGSRAQIARRRTVELRKRRDVHAQPRVSDLINHNR